MFTLFCDVIGFIFINMLLRLWLTTLISRYFVIFGIVLKKMRIKNVLLTNDTLFIFNSMNAYIISFIRSHKCDKTLSLVFSLRLAIFRCLSGYCTTRNYLIIRFEKVHLNIKDFERDYGMKNAQYSKQWDFAKKNLNFQ